MYASVTPEEMLQARDFLNWSLLRKTDSGFGIFPIQQSRGQLQFKRSFTGESIRISGRVYERGIGTHAVSEIRIVPPAPVRFFSAEVGFDSNPGSQNSKGRIIFVVESKGAVLWSSTPLSLGDEPVKVYVPMKEVKEFTLKVLDDGGGVDWKRADWADAAITMDNGDMLWLDAFPIMTFCDLPFSFVLGGESSRKFLAGWTCKHRSSGKNDRILHRLTWTDPDKNFLVRCEAVEFLNYPAVEYRLYFKNTGKTNSKTLKGALPLDLEMTSKKNLSLDSGGGFYSSIMLHYHRGSECNRYDFQPITEPLLDNQTLILKCAAGRSSEKYLPFWNLNYGSHGMVCGLGWSGAWKAEFDCNLRKNRLNMRAGMAEMETYLKAGEEISSPSVCLLFYDRKEAISGNNLFRRFFRNICMPRWNGGDPITLACGGGAYGLEGVNERNQMKFIRDIAGSGANVYWLDAGWYQGCSQGSWSNSRGNWFPDQKSFPRGLKPLSDLAHKHNLKFLLWFDPECVNPGTAIAEEHPEWVIRKGKGETGLFNLGIPEAGEYLTNLISSKIAEFEVDIYRNDFNIDPGPFWKMADKSGRKGITEIRYIEGLYRFWDGLRKRHPRLLIDNCASGGRRIDYETCKRSIPLWRSDVQCNPYDPLFSVNSQNQTYGLCSYLPVHATGTINLEKYNVRSIATSSVQLGVAWEFPDTPVAVPFQELKKRFAEIKSYSHFFLEDFYPLTEFSLQESSWMAYQFDSPEKGEGFAFFFRRSEAPYLEAEFELKALEPDSRYVLTFVDTGRKKTGVGREIEKVKVNLGKRDSALIFYRKLRKGK